MLTRAAHRVATSVRHSTSTSQSRYVSLLKGGASSAQAPELPEVQTAPVLVIPSSGAQLQTAPAEFSSEMTLMKSEFESTTMTSPAKTLLSSKQASDAELMDWLEGAVGLRSDVAREYAHTLQNDGFDSPAAIALASVEELERRRIRTGHARAMVSRVEELGASTAALSGDAAVPFGRSPPPQLFDYDTIVANLTVADAIEAVEEAFGSLAEGKVDVPMPMHIGIDETAFAGPGDCHIKGGYVSGASTWTVKLASVSFYKNKERGLSPGGGIFVVMNAVTGAPLAVFQENRFMTDLRTGAAGGIALKHTMVPRGAIGSTNTIGFIGCGAIARNMARGAAAVRPDFNGVAYAPDDSAEAFCREMEAELGVPFVVAKTAQECCGKSDAIYTQTPGSNTCLELAWLKPHCTIIASGSDQPTKQELPVAVLAASKYISDLTKQTSKVGELRAALADGAMTMDSVYAELGDVVNGTKPGREGKELIVVDLTGTGAQDAAIGQVAWDKLSRL